MNSSPPSPNHNQQGSFRRTLKKRIPLASLRCICSVFLFAVGSAKAQVTVLQPAELVGQPSYEADVSINGAPLAPRHTRDQEESPAGYSGMVIDPGTTFYSARDSVNQIEITTGYSAAFGSPRGYLIAGETTQIQTAIDLSKLDKSSISIRAFPVRNSSVFGFPSLQYFTLKFLGANGAAENEIFCDPEFGIYFPPQDSSLADHLGEIKPGESLGTFHLDSRIFLSSAAARFGVDLTFAIAVEDPQLQEVDTLRQFDSRWTSEPYGEGRYQDYIDDIGDDATHHDFANKQTIIDEKPACNLGNKGCLLTSLAMALRFLEVDPSATPNTIQKKVGKSGFTDAGFLLTSKVNASVLRFNGIDLKYRAIESAYPDVSLRPAHDAAEIIRALGTGFPVVLNVKNGGHWVLAKGAKKDPGTGEVIFNIIDPGTSLSSLQNEKFNGEFTLAQLRFNDKGFAVEKRSDLPTRSLSGVIQVNSPLGIIVIAPDGREVAFDAQGIIESDFDPSEVSFEFSMPLSYPDAPSYTVDEVNSFLADEYPPFSLWFSELQPGEYTIEAYGLDDGDFSIDFSSSDGGLLLSESGSVALDDVLQFNATLGLEPAKNLTLDLVEDPGAGTQRVVLNWQGEFDRTYQVESSLTMENGGWDSVGEVYTSDGVGHWISPPVDIKGGDSAFFRVRTVR